MNPYTKAVWSRMAAGAVLLAAVGLLVWILRSLGLVE